MHADSSAGREPANDSRTERVAHIGSIIGVLYGLASSLDEGKSADAVKGVAALERLLEALRSCVWEEIRQQAQTAREGQRSSEALHGEDSQDAQVTDG